MKQRRPDDVIRCSADADPMSKTIIGPMKLSVIGPMKHPSRARHRADEVVLVGYRVHCLGEGLSRAPPCSHVLCFPLPDRLSSMSHSVAVLGA